MTDKKITQADDAASSIPRPFRVSAALSWRALVIIAVLYVLVLAIGQLSIVVIPVAIALLLAALLAPIVSWLHRHKVPRALATIVVLVGGLAVVGGILTLVVNTFIAGFPDLQHQVLLSLVSLKHWLAEGPLHLQDQQIEGYIRQATEWLQRNQSLLTSGALSTATTFGNFLTGLILALFTLIFFLHDGRGIWQYLIKLVPTSSRHRVDVAGTRGFSSLVGYVRATALVAVADALGIGIGLTIIGVPLAIPLSALVFLGGFIPVVGAVASGTVAIIVALATKGWVAGLLVLAVVLAVQQIEGNVLQPALLGRAVSLHALAVVLAISAGAVLAGIIGALMSVPLVAVLNASIRSLVSGEGDEDAEGGPDESSGDQKTQNGDESAPPAGQDATQANSSSGD